MSKKPKPDKEAPQPETAPALTANAGADKPGSDMTVSEANDAGAAESAAAPNAPATVDLADPLPPGIPPEALANASLVVRAKPERGRWRAGRFFTRGVEAVIPLSELTDDQVTAIKGDRELVVITRVPTGPKAAG